MENEKKKIKQQKRGISRRDFIKGTAAGAVGIATMGVLGACSNDAASTSSKVVTGSTPSWFNAPTPIAEKDIIKTMNTEILVIGAGYAGVATACRAAEKGAKVIVVEKSARWNGRGGGTGVTNSRIMREKKLTVNTSRAQSEWVRTCGGRVNESLVSTYFNRSGEAMDWLLDKADVAKSAVILWGGYAKTDEPGYHMIMGGTGVKEGEFATVALLYNDSVKAGAQYVFNAPAEQLVKDGEKVVGAVVKTAKGYVKYLASKGVVVATGDIAADKEMLDYYAPIASGVASQYSPIGVNTGDGHKMGMWAGAVMDDGPLPTMMHPQAYAWFHGPFMFVNKDGKRFFNESTWVQAKSINIIHNTPDKVAYSVFDVNWPTDLLKGLPEGGGMFWDSFRDVDSDFDVNAQQAAIDGYVEQGLAFKANTLEELADKIGLNKENFLAEVKNYNVMCEKGEDTSFHKDKIFLTPIKKGPFYATKVGPALLQVVGGLQINNELQCIDASGKAIEGLYSLGNASGSIYAIDYPINIPGNSHGRCLTFGYLLGDKLGTL